MGSFKNEFAWSASRGGMLEQCARMFWLRYYGSWGGWEKNAHPGRRIAYRLGKMTGIPRWRGSLVHDSLEWGIGRISKRLPLTLQLLQDRAVNSMKTGWRQSRGALWVRDPKRNVMLFEHYYIGDTEDVQRQSRVARVAVECALQRWWDQGWHEVLQRLAVDDWVELEGLGTVTFRGVTIYVQPDLAYWRNGLLMVVDWKTGRPKPADDVQVLIYAIWAIKVKKVPMSQIRTQLVYLGADGSEKTAKVTEPDLRAFAERLWADIEGAQKRLSHVGRNEARARDFPKTTNLGTCARCDFKQLCHGRKEYPGPALAEDPLFIEEAESWPK